MKSRLFILLLCLPFLVKAQHKVSTQPHFNNSKDCYVQYVTPSCAPPSYAHIADSTGYRNNPVIHYMAWTFGGCFGITRTLIRFSDIKNTSFIPPGARILSAYITLYSPNTNLTGDAGNSSYSGSPYSSNPGWCYQTTDSFNATSVSWNTQPNIKHKDSVSIRESYYHWGDSDQIIYVTNMVRDMYTNVNTGFKLILQNESYYRQRLFASGRFPDSTLHPRLTVIWVPTIIIHDSTRCNTIWFSASADTSIASYKWFFGDGDSGMGRLISHGYSSSGTYYPKLVVTYHGGIIDTTYDTVHVASTGNMIYTINDSVKNCNPVYFNAIHISGDIASSLTWYFGDGTTGVTNPIIHTYTASGTYNVALVLTDTSGCTDSATTNVTVTAPIPIHAYPDTAICIGASVQLHAIGAISYSWAPSQSLDNNTIANPIATPDISTLYTITGIDSNGCTTSDSLMIKVNRLPNVIASINNNYKNCNTHKIQLVANGAKYYQWQPAEYCDDAESSTPLVIFPNTVQLFSVSATDSNGCVDTASVTVNKHLDVTVGLPAAFSPNGDGANDILYIRGANIGSVDFSIFNRWGQVVFQTNDLKHGWDGTRNGVQQPIESYAYVLKISSLDGCNETKTGSITLLR